MAHVIEPALVLELPTPPRVNSKYCVTKKGQFFVSPEHKKYKDTVRKLLTEKRVKPVSGDIGVIILWYRQRKRGDIDGILKTLLDSLTGFAYEDDSQVCELSVFRSDCDPSNPRVVVKIIDLFTEEDFTIDD